MTFALRLLTGFVALEHYGFMILEMFLWTKPVGLRIFNQSQSSADSSKVLAKNQGLYNGFLAAGLTASLLTSRPEIFDFCTGFFLICVAIAGIFGALTVNRKIFLVQALPALVGLYFYFAQGAASSLN